MKTISWNLENGKNGCDLEGEIEAEDDATEEDIDAAVREDMWNWLSLTWYIKDEASAPTSAESAT